MAIVIIRQDGKIDLWKNALLEADPSLKVYSYLENHPENEIMMALIWKHPNGSLTSYKNLKCIASAGAGVDYIFEDETVPKEIPITRIVDPYLAGDMSEHVLATILAHIKNLNAYKLNQVKGIWKPKDYKRIKDTTIGIMGLGELGALTATDLSKVFLNTSKILVCLLPLTPETTGILNKELFQKLPKDAFVINVARGGHLVDEDVLDALDSGHLSGACLDVYHQEPLPTSHPFWNNQKIHMTPHYASVSDTSSVIPQIVENYKRLRKGEPLLNEVDRNKGY